MWRAIRLSFFKFLSGILLVSFSQEDKQLVITENESAISKPLLQNLVSLSPCSHEEADSRMWLHANHAAHNGHQNIMIRTVDTDVVALSVYVAQTLGPEYELWVAFGTDKHFRYLAAHSMAVGLGPMKAKVLPMFHALTGCDTVSSFVGHSIKTAWSTWNALPDLTDTLLTLSSSTSFIEEDVIHIIERFVILMYDRTSTCHDINKA